MMKTNTQMGTSESLVNRSLPPTSLTSSDRMGRIADRLNPEAVPSGTGYEDEIVVDDRSGLSPAQAVEDRLSRMMTELSLPVSHLQMRGMLRTR